jgi:hypothetical protein
MTLPGSLARLLVVVVLGGVVAAGGAAKVAAQLPAGMHVSWADLETWSRHDERAQETEVGLGLHLTGPSGAMLLSFTSRFPGKVALRAPEGVIAFVSVTPTVNPNVLRKPTLVFLLEPKTKLAATMDMSQRLSVDRPGPGQVYSNGRASMSPEEYLRLTGVTTMHAELLGFNVEFRRDQIRAMRDFGERIHIRPKGK